MPAESETSPPDEGMIDLEAFEALEASQGVEEPEPEVDDGLPAISDQRLRELKDGARRMIEDRLLAKRRQRRLMRGGDPGR